MFKVSPSVTYKLKKENLINILLELNKYSENIKVYPSFKKNPEKLNLSHL